MARGRPAETTLRRPVEIASVAGGRVEYRLDRRGDDVVLIMHGGHMRAGLALGEDELAAAGYTILVPSRPGYGRTPLASGRTVAAFTDTARALCDRLGVARVAAVVGVSGGGPTAVTMAARHPDLVQRLVLISAVGPLPWPDPRTRLGARLVFPAGMEALTWAGLRLFLRLGGRAALRRLLGSLSNARGAAATAGIGRADELMLRELFGAMRSGHGFVHDLRPVADRCGDVRQPALIVAAPADGGVPFAHARALAAALPAATLIRSGAAGHFVWCAPDWPGIARQIITFLRASPR